MENRQQGTPQRPQAIGSAQQQQFSTQGMGQQGGGAGSEAPGLAERIREHMEVVGPDGTHIGIVDSVDGDRIKLTKADSGADPEGHHRFVPMCLVQAVDADRVTLRSRGDANFGMEAGG